MNAPSGFSIATQVPWLVALSAVGVAAWALLRPVPAPSPVPTADEGGEVRRLRLALAASSSEASALREELDRLLERYRGSLAPEGPRRDRSDPAAEPTPSGGKDPRLADLAETYQASLLRSIAGDEAAGDEAYDAIMQLLRAGPAAFPLLRDAYLSTSDPEARIVMLRSLVAADGAEARSFLASQLEAEQDPDVRGTLALRASELAGPSAAPLFRDSFLDLLRTTEDPELRAASVRGLRHLRGDEDVREALLAAASDPSPAVRIAAYESLASRPSSRTALRTIVADDPDPEARAVGRCRLLLAERPAR